MTNETATPQELEKRAADIEAVRRYVAERTPSVEEGGRRLLEAGRRIRQCIKPQVQGNRGE